MIYIFNLNYVKLLNNRNELNVHYDFFKNFKFKIFKFWRKAALKLYIYYFFIIDSL